jgi:hypothetical protein
VVDGQRDHGRQSPGARVVAQVLIPDAGDVPEHAEGHERVVAALVLGQQVDVGITAVKGGGEQQVGVAPFEGFVDEAGGHRGEPGQVEAGGQVLGEDSAQLRSHVLGQAEDPAEHRVVRGDRAALRPAARRRLVRER